MFRRMCVMVVLACVAFLSAGCGRGTGPKGGAANLPLVTLHVPDMTDRQGLT